MAKVQTLLQQAQTYLQAGRTQQAVELLQQIAFDHPNEPRCRFILGFIAHRAGQLPLALDCLNKAIAIEPAAAEPYFVLGFTFYQQNQFPQAIDAYRKFLARKPNDGKGLNNLGRALLDQGNTAEALEILKKAVEVSPGNAGAYSNLGEALRKNGDAEQALIQYRKAIAIDPNSAEAHGNLGAALVRMGDKTGAIASMKRAIELNPRLFNAQLNLARTIMLGGPLDAAAHHCRLALEIRPDAPNALDVMANIFGLTGQMQLCLSTRRRALELKPDSSDTHSNLLMSLHYQDDLSQQQIFDAHLQWARLHESTTPMDHSRQSRDSNDKRRLRIGYVSPDFQSHSVAFFFEPVLAAHDRSVVEVFCYSNLKLPDAVTARIRAKADAWREISGVSDQVVAQMIEKDQIDILIDLAGHTSDNRLGVFAHKPAPIQMSWLGYPSTTGMKTIDYRLTDPIADPPGVSDAFHSEKLLRIDGGCWAYQASASPEIGPFPGVSNGFVTFGSFNNLPKVTPKVIETWSAILNQVPNSRLLLKAAGLGSNMGREYVQNQFASLGISSDRVELVSWISTTQAHLKLYDRVDIALDTFPYNGTTTTCEALWMGVPVVTFAGTSHVSRVGAALLTHAGLTDWIASDVAGYIDLAIRLAGNLQNMAKVRQTLRDKLQQSPVCDGARLAKQLETIFQQVWAARPGKI